MPYPVLLDPSWTEANPMSGHKERADEDCESYTAAAERGSTTLRTHALSDSTANGALVSCGSKDLSAAVDGSFDAYLYNGSKWSSSSSDQLGALDAISFTVHQCVAGDNIGNVIASLGGHLSKPLRIARNPISSFSCPSPRFCMAVTGSGSFMTYASSTSTT